MILARLGGGGTKKNEMTLGEGGVISRKATCATRQFKTYCAYETENFVRRLEKRRPCWGGTENSGVGG